ncbi:MAG TPA: hypothetical protein VHC67_10345 [Gaiellaceae bacterium]|nr:hypothetical protein [Gaiellaceae bacterium]
MQDDAWLRWGPPPFTGSLESRLNLLDTLGVKLVRFTLVWRQVAPTEPRDPTDPNDPAYDWHAFDPVMRGLHAHHITTLVTLWGAPAWTNGGHAANFMPTRGIGNFAYAAARRYPWVRLWTAWNEPNLRTFAAPVSPANYVRNVLNPAWSWLHRANRANRVAGGVTSPRATPSGMGPVAFAEAMRRAHARLDAYAANPHPVSRSETPFGDPCRPCRTLTMARLGMIRRLVTRLWGARTPLWLTEYAVETNPPQRARGLPWPRQALFVSQSALRVWQQPNSTLLIWFLVRDEPNVAAWQSGFFTTNGVPKPSRAAFALPLAQLSRRRTRTVLWGQVRPGTGRRPYAIQRIRNGRWVNVGGWRTGVGGTFRVAVNLGRGTRVRLRSSRSPWPSPALVVR